MNDSTTCLMRNVSDSQINISMNHFLQLSWLRCHTANIFFTIWWINMFLNQQIWVINSKHCIADLLSSCLFHPRAPWSYTPYTTVLMEAFLFFHDDKKVRCKSYLITGPSCRRCSRRMSGLSLLRSRWMKIRVSCTNTHGTSVKSRVKPCQIWSPAERYVVLRYNAAVVSAVNRETDTRTELGSLILSPLTPPFWSASVRCLSHTCTVYTRHTLTYTHSAAPRGSGLPCPVFHFTSKLCL